MPALTARCMKVNQEMVVCSVYEYSPVVARYSDYMLSAVRQNGVVTSFRQDAFLSTAPTRDHCYPHIHNSRRTKGEAACFLPSRGLNDRRAISWRRRYTFYNPQAQNH
jgi:hypothetical protein